MAIREHRELKHRAKTAVRVHVLLKVYAKCIEGQDGAARQRIAEALSR